MFTTMELPDPASTAALLTALLAGLVSFLSPCVAPLLPGYVAFIADGVSTRRRVATARALGFVAGFGILFTLLGVTAAAFGQALARERATLELVGGIVVALLGLSMASGRSPMPQGAASWLQQRSSRLAAPTTAVAAMPVGAAFALAWTPCIGPVLASILAVAASDGQPARGAALLAAYAIGLGLPFVLGALALDRLTAVSAAIRTRARSIQVVSGGALILLGIAIASGGFGRLTAWLARLTPGWIA